MSRWRNFEKLKKICMTVIASQLDDSEIKKLQVDFQKLDKTGDGVISKEEFMNGLKKAKISHPDMEKIFSSIDSDKSGVI